MLLRAQLAEALRKWMEREGLTQAQAAKRLGIAQPRVSDIVRGKVELLSLDYLFAPRRTWTSDCVSLLSGTGVAERRQIPENAALSPRPHAPPRAAQIHR